MDLINYILRIIVVIVVPLCTIAFLRFLLEKVTQIESQTTNETTKAVMAELREAVSTAVSAINQVYVDTLKQTGAFDTEKQKQVLNQCVSTVKNLISERAREFLSACCYDSQNLIVTLIEAEVRDQKRK